MTGGKLGEIFASLAFSGALVAMVSFFLATRREGKDRSTWEKLATGGWYAHVVGVIGIIGTLFYLIYSHQYQYHYVWNHSSNELPVYYMISCFWEGQEGSFLLWVFWHALLGTVLWFTAKSWRNIVLAVVASVNLILMSMILGVYIPEIFVQGFFAAGLAALAFLLARNALSKGAEQSSYFRLAAACMGFIAATAVLLGKTAFFGWKSMLPPFDDGVAYGLLSLALLVLVVWGLAELFRLREEEGSGLHFAAYGVLALSIIVAIAPFGAWKIGSTPFILMRDAIEAPIFAINPDFVPDNGTGLNSLLQNYWMVIHPPTLFLGFAATVVPFAYVTGGLITRRYTEWIRPAMPWMLFSALILGVGIIMGGYWAYETLNFGGYWNWDPVENSSLVPWLVAVAGVHAALAWQKQKKFLVLTMVTVVSAFWLVLYSTFLTRSGVLGEGSVHSFTDLGLSGQLLLLLFFYVTGLIVLFSLRRKELNPPGKLSIPLVSSESFLFYGTVILLSVSLIITMFTSLPVFNKIFGLSMAAPEDHNFFYYRWTVWFAIMIGIFSAVGQFLFWRNVMKASLSKALLRPFVLAVLLASVVVFSIAIFGGNWIFEDRIAEWQELASFSENFIQKAFRWVRILIYAFSDEVLLLATLFSLTASLDIFIRLMRRNDRSRRITGGPIAHAGFALMILGIFFSSGYEQTLSKNVNPQELPMFAPKDRVDNVLLAKDRPRNIFGYQIEYLGKKEALAPVSDLFIMQEDAQAFKVKFTDATGDEFAETLPRQVFAPPGGDIELSLVEEFLNDRVEVIKPAYVNERRVYRVQLTPRYSDPETREVYLDTAAAFILYPEDENNEGMGRISHPARKIRWDEDIYVNVYGWNSQEEEEPQFEYHDFDIGVGDTVQTGRALIYFDGISADSTDGTRYELIARAHLVVATDQGNVFKAEPLYRIDKGNLVSIKDHYIEEIWSSIALTQIDHVNSKVHLRVQERTNPPDDLISIKVSRKPYINLLWLGTFVLTIGFFISMRRRWRESRKRKD